MRWLVTIVVIAIIAFFGYRYFYTGEGQQLAEQAEQATEQAATEVEETAKEATEAVEGAADEATEAVEGAVDQTAERAEQGTEATEQAAERATDSAEQAAESAEETTAALTVEGVDLGKEVGTSVSDTVGALEGITDKASAEAALPDLKAVGTKLDGLSGKVEKLPQEAKASLASLLGDSLPELQDLVNKIEGMQGVGEVVKPTLDGIMTKLDAWAKQPA
jgi:predicted negative regulator of RcsB-dependent stress response